MVQQPCVRTRKDLLLGLLLTYLCFRVWLFHSKGKCKGTIILLSSYTGEQERTDVESGLRLNPSAGWIIHHSHWSHLPEHTNGFWVCPRLGVNASVCGSLVHRTKTNTKNTQNRKHPARPLMETFTDSKRTWDIDQDSIKTSVWWAGTRQTSPCVSRVRSVCVTQTSPCVAHGNLNKVMKWWCCPWQQPYQGSSSNMVKSTKCSRNSQ